MADGTTNESDIFSESILTEKVRLSPDQLASDLRDVIFDIVRERNEGRCSRYGYIRPGSVRVLKVSAGRVRMVSLNGDVIFTVQFKADVCNPVVGTVVKAVIRNTNKFGILAEVGFVKMEEDREVTVPVMEVIVTKQGVGIASAVNLERLRVGEAINVEILGKKYELNDLKICAIGKVVETAFKGGADDDLPQDDGDEVGVDDVPADGETDDGELEEEEEEEEEEEKEGVEEEESDGESLLSLEDDFDEEGSVIEPVEDENEDPVDE